MTPVVPATNLATLIAPARPPVRDDGDRHDQRFGELLDAETAPRERELPVDRGRRDGERAATERARPAPADRAMARRPLTRHVADPDATEPIGPADSAPVTDDVPAEQPPTDVAPRPATDAITTVLPGHLAAAVVASLDVAVTVAPTAGTLAPAPEPAAPVAAPAVAAGAVGVSELAPPPPEAPPAAAGDVAPAESASAAPANALPAQAPDSHPTVTVHFEPAADAEPAPAVARNAPPATAAAAPATLAPPASGGTDAAPAAPADTAPRSAVSSPAPAPAGPTPAVADPGGAAEAVTLGTASQTTTGDSDDGAPTDRGHPAPAPTVSGGPLRATPAHPGAPLAGQAPVVDADPTDLLAQAELNRLAGGNQHLDLDIDTAHLGRVRVEAVDQRGAVSIQIHTDRADARALLDQQLGGLHAELSGADVRHGTRDGDTRHAPRGDQSLGLRATVAASPAARQRPGLPTPDRGVDVYA